MFGANNRECERVLPKFFGQNGICKIARIERSHPRNRCRNIVNPNVARVFQTGFLSIQAPTIATQKATKVSANVSRFLRLSIGR